MNTKHNLIRPITLISLGFAIVIASCSPVPGPSDYSGINFLDDGAAFSSSRWTTSDPGLMTFEEASSTGGPSGGAAYRLEVKNHFVNGDMSSDPQAVNGGQWSITLATNGNDTITFADGAMDLTLSNAATTVDLANPAILLGTGNQKRYVYYFDTINNNDANSELFISFVLEDQADGSSLKLRPYPANTTLYFPFDFIEPGSGEGGNPTQPLQKNTFTIADSTKANEFYFGEAGNPDSSYQMDARIDNVRMVRDGLDYAASLTVLYGADGRADLPSGDYELSLYIKNDDDTSANRYPSTAVRLGYRVLFPQAQDSIRWNPSFFEPSDSWEQVVIAVPSAGTTSLLGDWQLNNPSASSTTPIVEIYISPTGANTTIESSEAADQLRPGSVLIAQPVLTYVSK